MPLPTPFHPRTSALVHSMLWKEWAGYAAVRAYDGHSEREYFAVRHAVGLIDVSPLYKLDFRGRDAGRVLAYAMSRDINKLGVGRATYGCLLDPAGKVLDDGTVTRLGDDWYRLSSSEPWLRWFQDLAVGREVSLEDTSASIAVVAVQGPRSRATLERIWPDVRKLGFFRALSTDGLLITRTGYTGDLGYEVWVPAERACDVWDRLMEAGAPHGVTPFGLDALDVLRIEAGFVLQGIDYISARATLLERRKSTPDECGLGWTVDLERERFLGQAAIRAERARPAQWALVGLELSWPEIEALYASYGVPPHLAPVASREPVPVYGADGRTFVGYVTSRTWSPRLKRSLALATVQGPLAKPGTRVHVEYTVEHERRTVSATVVDKPFYDPAWKRGGPDSVLIPV